MRRRWILPILIAAAAAAPAQSSPQVTGVPTETQQRLARTDDGGFDWNWLGLLGLFGLLGFRRGLHAEEGYHPAPLD